MKILGYVTVKLQHTVRWFMRLVCHNQSRIATLQNCMAIGVKQDEKQICIKFATLEEMHI